jgi:DeoR/GlpR family transcriptional regulator of sugar metabolism
MHMALADLEIFPVERRQQILESLRRDGKVVARDLAKELSVSIDTVRRDLNHLVQEGFIQRVHGGAMLASPPVESVLARQGRNLQEKQAAAKKAVGLIQAGQIVFIDIGTTLNEMARLVDKGLRFTVVTRNLRLALILTERTEADVVFLGGQINRMDLASCGAPMIREIASVRADLCFLGLCGIHQEAGLTTRRLEEVELFKAMIQSSGAVVGVGTREKVGTAGPFVIGPVTLLDYLAVAPGLPESEAAGFQRQGIEVI